MFPLKIWKTCHLGGEYPARQSQIFIHEPESFQKMCVCLVASPCVFEADWWVEIPNGDFSLGMVGWWDGIQNLTKTFRARFLGGFGWLQLNSTPTVVKKQNVAQRVLVTTWQCNVQPKWLLINFRRGPTEKVLKDWMVNTENAQSICSSKQFLNIDQHPCWHLQ